MKTKQYSKFLLLFLLIYTFVWLQTATGQTKADGLGVVVLAELEQCKKITSSLQRLACFDQVAGTPAHFTDTATNAVTQESMIIALVEANEKKRVQGNLGFIMTESVEAPQEAGGYEGARVVISAPSIGKTTPRPYLAISCIYDISRLQIITDRAVAQNSATVKLYIDGRLLPGQATWHVLDSGKVVDAGRGTLAINLLRQLRMGEYITIKSDYEYLDGLKFEAKGLTELIQKERQACHW